MLTRLRTPGVLPSMIFAFIILWALLAVFMLINTLVAAQQIDEKVGVINEEVAPIDEELDNVVLAEKTGEISTGIRESAAPLSGQLTQTHESVKRIDASGEKILASAGTINTSVKEINASVQEINGTVDTIGATLNSVEGSANSINGSVDGITASFGGIFGEVVSIDAGAAGINRRVTILISQIEGIAANLDVVTNEHVPAIMTNAAAIEGSPLLLNGVDSAELLRLNQLVAAAAMPPGQAVSERGGALAVPDAGELPEPLRSPVADVGELRPVGPQQSPRDDTGSILDSVTGGL